METSIGPTLREARGRRNLDLAEVEAAIKVRVRFLRAIENEEWDALPGGAYTRSFIRTYANFLGLDGERLVDDYRRAAEQQGGPRVPQRVEPVATGVPRARSPLRARLLIAAVSIGLVGALIGIGLAGGDDERAPAPPPTEESRGAAEQRPQPAPEPGVAVKLAATDEVWVCLVDARGEPLVEGEILAAGEEAGPFRSRRFEAAFGNGSVTLLVGGEPAELPPSASPVGYAIDSGGAIDELQKGERPDCE